MDSSAHPRHVHDPNHISTRSGLLRFHSAPSSLLAVFIDDETGGFASDRLTSRFVSSNGGNADLGCPNLCEIEDKPPVTAADTVTPPPPPPTHPPASYSALLPPPHYPRESKGIVSSDAMDGSYRFLGMIHHNTNTKPIESDLVRQSSSPAGMFTNLSVQNGYGCSFRSLLSYGGEEEQNPSPVGSTRQPPPLGMLSRISEIDTETIISNFHYGHWDDPSSSMPSFSSMKSESDDMGRSFFGVQTGERSNPMQLPSRHLSLPKASGSDMGSGDKCHQLQDSVPWNIRAKRGCATHPRSIAERVRRTRISERMRKLQELVPNMDKQTNTTDMLDLAVEYIKDLQRQFKILSESRVNCKCFNTEEKAI